MLGFAVVDAQDDRVAVWLVGRTEQNRAGSTNAVVTDRSDTDTLDLLTGDRIVLRAPGGHPESLPAGVDVTQVIDRMSIAGLELRTVCRRQWRTLRLPDVPFDVTLDAAPSEQLVSLPTDAPELPQRTVAWANGLIKAWSFWLATESVRHRKVMALQAAGKTQALEDTISAEIFAVIPPELRETGRTSDA
ncbi:hypothetical protein [Janibacter sp. Soil728]|uniref:hypothetical protein n=1 Tax=Janibacter sp. Soil728 TaxID=1736393 RepID=UPI0012E8BCED|nr:hypothetical protein [Janibacter sp. Soil728]